MQRDVSSQTAGGLLRVGGQASIGDVLGLVNSWIYILGAACGSDVKVGVSNEDTLRDRVASVNREQTTSTEYRLLAGLLGTRKDEGGIHDYFADLRRGDKGRRREYYRPSDEIVEYANWLRSQWWVTHDIDEPRSSLPLEDPSHWMPNEHRRIARGTLDPGLLVQLDQDLEGPLAGTPWDWMVSDAAQVQDYYTPAEIIDAARTAMGGIDLDAASHYLANRQHRIPEYFHTGRSAFSNDWYGRVWLNPPFGDNLPWFQTIIKYVDSGAITDLCMLSPTWAFTTTISSDFMEYVTAHVLLSPTPKFWGNRDKKTGSNHPHSIVYIGDRVDEFHAAFQDHGIVMSPPRARVAA